MSTRLERSASIVMMLLAAGFGLAAVSSSWQKEGMQSSTESEQILHVSTEEIIGPRHDFAGVARGPYTLVEFGDYQCTPCHIAAGEVPVFLNRYHGRLRFTFRNLPLTMIHPSAMQAALDAETARTQGRFWEVHDALYKIPPASFSDEAVNSTMKVHPMHIGGIITINARKAVEADVQEAKRLGIESTPTFILCQPDGTVIRLQNIDRIDHYMH